MKKLPDIVRYCNLESVGEVTQNIYRGDFRFKVVLSHDERFTIERTYAQMLPNDKSVSEEIRIRAASLAELEQRIVSAPRWWTDSRNGRDLIDSQPIYDLVVQIDMQFKEWQSELSKVAEIDKQ